VRGFPEKSTGRFEMSPLELQQRAAVVAEAETWLGTPYHHEARIKGHGVDCAQILVGVFANVGLIEPVALPHYPADWNLHRDEERYLDILARYTREIEAPVLCPLGVAASQPGASRSVLPGDIVVWKFGRCFSHGAIVVAWPFVIHAYVGSVCVLEDAERASWLAQIGDAEGAARKPRPRKFFSYWS
jgi:cell wall-associated NlpC family hydrolase